MAGELNLKYSATGKTILALILGQDRTTRWNGSAMAALSTVPDANWTTGMVTLAEQKSSNNTNTATYVGHFPVGVAAAGEYVIEFYLNTAATPGSQMIGCQTIWWDGTKLVSPASAMILTPDYDPAKTAGNATIANQNNILGAVQGITRNTARSTITGPTWFVRPASGVKQYRLGILLYNLQGVLEDPDDNAVHVHARLADNTSMDGRLSATTLNRISVGQYELLGYSVAGLDQTVPHPAEAVTFDFSWAVGAGQMKDSYSVEVQDAESLETMLAILTAIGAPVSGSLAADIAGVKTDTQKIPANPADRSDLPPAPDNSSIALIKNKTDKIPDDPAHEATVNSRLAADSYVAPDNTGITAIKAQTDKIPDQPAAVGSAMTLQPADREALATALLDLTNAVDGKTLRQVLQIISAVLAGKVSGAGSGTETFRGVDDQHDRVVVTADVSGNRTNVTYQ